MFNFKKFSIDDSTAAMKVGTDSVLLGAWVSCDKESRILDIGAGSGILSLMMAQRNEKTAIDAVEADPDAANLAKLNVKLSPWPDQIHIFSTTIQDFSVKAKQKYSLIICNPPFFTNSLKAPDKARNLARHNDSLPVAELLDCTANLLTENGNAAFIIPADAYENWRNEAAKLHLFPKYLTWVKSSPTHAPHRAMVLFSRKKDNIIQEDDICIYTSEKNHDQEYKEITRDFYLKF